MEQKHKGSKTNFSLVSIERDDDEGQVCTEMIFG